MTRQASVAQPSSAGGGGWDYVRKVGHRVEMRIPNRHKQRGRSLRYPVDGRAGRSGRKPPLDERNLPPSIPIGDAYVFVTHRDCSFKNRTQAAK